MSADVTTDHPSLVDAVEALPDYWAPLQRIERALSHRSVTFREDARKLAVDDNPEFRDMAEAYRLTAGVLEELAVELRRSAGAS